MSAPFPKMLWLVTIDKTTMVAKPVEAETFKWQHFLELTKVINRFNRDKKAPVELTGPFWTKEDAERFVRAHHTRLRQRVRRASKNPR